jgi:hypothetical protein
MAFIRKLAVMGYSKDIERMINSLSQLSVEKVAYILIYSVWMRAMLEVERNLPVIENEDGSLDPELHSYPILLKEIEKWISICKKSDRTPVSVALSIWVHTLRSIIRPELTDLADKLWNILMSSKPYWEKTLSEIKNGDIESGIEHNIVLSTEKHAKGILQCLPPKQLSKRF